jgi:hypothetical protein
MNFMNEYEIDEAVDRFRDDPILGPASQTLANLRTLANRNSDGWAYWPKPARAANKLMLLLQDARRPRDHRDPHAATAAQLRAAYSPIKAFLTRSGLECTIVPPR